MATFEPPTAHGAIKENDGGHSKRAPASEQTGAPEPEDRIDATRVEGLLHSEERWRLAVDGTGDGVWDWDMSLGRVFYSRRWKAMLGYAEEEVGDAVTEWSDRVHPEDMPRCWAIISDHFASNTPDFAVEHRMRAKDGSWRWILDRGKVVKRARDGTPQRTIGTHTDVTDRKNEEVNVHLERERLTLAKEASGLGMWDYNLDADVLLCDERLHEIFGVDPATPVDTIEKLNALIHPDDLDRVVNEREMALNRKEKINIKEFRVVMPGGETRWIWSAARLLEPTAVTPNRLVGVMRDVTERHIAEQKLQNSYQALRQAEKLARIGSWSLDLKTSTFIASDMLKEMNRMGPDDPPRTPDRLKDVLPPAAYEKVRAGIERCIAQGLPYDVESEYARVDGTKYFAHIRGTANLDASGKTIGITGTVQDISEREEARARFEALADNLPNSVIYRLEHSPTRGFELTYISAGIYAFIGIAPAELVGGGSLLRESIHEDDRAGYEAERESSLQTRHVFDCKFRVLTRDGSIVWLHSRSAPRYQTDRSTVWDGIMRDITEECQAARILEEAKDAAEAAERAKSDFLATMSHEIRTPMNTVLGMTRLALLTELAPRQKNYLDKIHTAANTLISIINDVLDFSKIEAGKLELEETDFTLESVLESVSAVTAMKAEEKGLEIMYAVGTDVHARFKGDPLRLGQVLINLVNNAVKFTDHGEVVVKIDRAPQSEAEHRTTLQFAVRDTGIGLDAGQIAGLFRAFSQAERSTSRKYGGTGLGLAICKQLVERMGGEIWVSSAPGEGATFSFTIQTALATESTVPKLAVKSTQLNGLRVLIVDDNESARDILSQMVLHFGMQVEVVSSGVSALAALKTASFKQQPFDLVLMDWRMPDMDGLEAAQRIMSDRDLRQTPSVLMVTAFGREEVLRRSEQIGLQGVLIKPVTESVMFNTIIDILGRTHRIRHAEATEASDGRNQPNFPNSLSKDPWTKQLHHRRVLVVDDNALNLEVVGDFLALAGVDVETACNGRDAVEKLEASTYDAVLMDVHMPIMDGLTAAREIRKNPRWAELPIIALTAQARTEDRQASLAAGMNAHLTKPIDETELYRTLLDLLAQGQAPANSADSIPVLDSPSFPAHTQAAIPAPPPLDLSAALARLGNNRERLSRLLHGFLRDFDAAPQQISTAYREDRLDDLVSLAHAVKGSASYLNANNLCALAERLENAARQSNHDVLEMEVLNFRRQLEKVLESLKRETSAEAGRAVESPESDISGVLLILLEAELLLAHGDYAAQPLLEKLDVRFAGTAAATTAEEIRTHFEDLEYDSALDALRRLRHHLQQQPARALAL